MMFRAKQHWLVCAFLLLGESSAHAGVSLSSLHDLPAMQMSRLLVQTKPISSEPQQPTPSKSLAIVVSPEHAALKDSTKSKAATLRPEQAENGLSLPELLKSEAVSFAQLVERARKAKVHATSLDAAMHEHAIATALPKTTKFAANAKVVRVEIPSAPLEEEDPKVTLIEDTSKASLQVKAPVVKIAPRVTAAPAEAVVKPTAAPVVAATNATVPSATATNAASQQKMQLKITGTGPALTLYPPILKFSHVGARADVKINVRGVEDLSLFVRDGQTLAWDRKKNELRAGLKGSTELYVVAGGKMYIVPIIVEDAAPNLSLKVPQALVSLDGVLGKTTQSALYPTSTGEALQATAKPAQSSSASAGGEQAPNLQASLAETNKTLQANTQTQVSARYAIEKKPLAYRQVNLQLVDDRSNVAAGIIYPASQVEVELVGTEFRARTDATGHLSIPDVPAHSRFMLKLTDPTGAIAAAVAELVIDDVREGAVMRIPVMRRFSLDANAQIAQTVQNAGLGSLCATVRDLPADAGDHPKLVAKAGVSVGLDIAADGPYYFNAMGYLDRSLQATGPDGRFCYYNVPTGVAALSLQDATAILGMVPVAIHPGRHTEERIQLSDERRIRTRLAAVASAAIQLGSDARQANAYGSVDMIDLLPLGTDEPMMQLNSGLISTQDPVLAHRGRLYAVAQGSDFESVLYQYDRRPRVATNAANSTATPAATELVTPLLPRGFVEDMAIYAQVTHDPSLGTVMAEYEDSGAAGSGSVAMRLVDQDGSEVATAWYFADHPHTKALFFNVPSGIYTLQVETADKYWLAADTVIVYNETVSYMQLGGALRFQP